MNFFLAGYRFVQMRKIAQKNIRNLINMNYITKHSAIHPINNYQQLVLQSKISPTI